MGMSLGEIIEKETGQKASPSKLAKAAGLAVSTANDALKREVTKSSFGTIVLILNASNISVEKVAQLYSEEKMTPEKAERIFLAATDLSKLTIMGTQFSTPENFWQVRDTLINGIYEGLYPDESDIVMLKDRIENKKTSEQLIAELYNEVQKKADDNEKLAE